MKQGRVLADRYLLEAPGPFTVPGAEAWLAQDTRLDRHVTVLVATDANPALVRDAASRARVLRDPRLARIIEVGAVETVDAGTTGAVADEVDADRAFVVVERTAGTSVADLLLRRIVPPEVARAIIGEAARALEAAADLGLRHGAIQAGWLTVTPRGKVVVGGAGIVASLVASRPQGRTVSERDDVRALAGVFVRAITGLRPRAATPTHLPPDLTATDRTLVAGIAKPGGPTTFADLAAALAPWDAALLRGLARRQIGFAPHPSAPKLAPAEPVAPPRAPRTRFAPSPVPIVVVAPPAKAESPAAPTRALGSAPAPVEVAEDEEDDWGFDRLEVLVDADHMPSVFEAFLGLLNRRFPRASPVARLLEKVHARASAGPRLHVGRWFAAAGVLALLLGLIVAIRGILAPFVPTIDLHNPPEQHYPEFTLGPSPEPLPLN